MLEVLAEAPPLPPLDLPAALVELYGGELGLGEQSVVANFVQTIDGLVALPELERSNAVVADASDADRFVMGLLRAAADAILIGSGTLNASPTGTWLPGKAFPAAAGAFAELRSRRGRPAAPEVAIVTGGGSLDRSHPLLEQGAVVLTTAATASGLRAHVSAACDVIEVAHDGRGRVDLAAALAALRARGHGIVLSEAGPHVFGSLLRAGLVDELFLTVSPLLAGRSGLGRLSLVEGVELLPEHPVRGRLLSLRRHGEHLFARYALEP